jgi:NAD(P) transhydrogenase
MDPFDIIVIGTGPAGEGAAMTGTRNHRRVAVVERYLEVGGGCTHWGTIPSKALRHAVKTLRETQHDPLLKSLRHGLHVDYPHLLANAKDAIEAQVTSRLRFYERNEVPVFAGAAWFIDPHTIEVRPDQPGHGVPRLLRANHIVLASGSRPYHPRELDFTHPRVRDSDSILHYEDDPCAVTIFGGGVIGCEYASIFLGLGCKVTLINTHRQLLSFLDQEIAEALSSHLHEQGCVIRHGEQFARLETRDTDVVLELDTGRRIRSDLLLWAAGRIGNSDGMNLEAIGIVPNSRGHIAINEYCQTALPHIYAAGDVGGRPALASAAYVQGCRAMRHIINPDEPPQRADLVPSGIYTLPEISSVGLTERELLERRTPYEVGRASFNNLARAQLIDERIGLLKILFHAETLQLLGVHCFGDGAAEIVHIGQTVMASSDLNSVRYFLDTTFNVPTMAEAYRLAAYNGLNRLN